MVGLGTLINTGAVVLGGLLGYFFGNRLSARHQESLSMACGISVLFLGIAGAMEGMLAIEGSGLVSGQAMFVVLSLTIGALVGEILNIEDWLEKFGTWLKRVTGNGQDSEFVSAFLTATLTVCIGAMAIVGSIQDGILGDYTILAIKAVLDMIIVMVMTASLGKGCIFSAVPVFLFQGSMTLLARSIKPLITQAAMDNISLIGSILIFCVGLNLVWGKKIRVANFLPAILIGILFAFFPIGI